MSATEPSKRSLSVAAESGLLGKFAGEAAIARDEHTANVLALRTTAVFGLVAWALFGLTDVFIVNFVEPGRLWLYLMLRGLGLIVISLVAWRLHRAPSPSPRMLRFLDTATFTSTAALVSVSCIEFRGLESPLTLGVVTILICRTAMVPNRWQQSLLPIGLTASIHPVVLLSLALFSQEVYAQLHDSRAVGAFILNQLFLFGAAAISIAGSHRLWMLRRKVYEARSLGRYRLKRRIGRGGMGEVWIAHHATLDRDVAVKILRPDKMNEEAVVRFEREVRATSDLSHPNTIRVFDFGVTEDGLCYYAMELLDGEDLSSYVKANGPLDAARVVNIASQVASALAEAHQRGIVHRDLKPGNLVLTSLGGKKDFVKVVDFGLALMPFAETEDSVTNTGFIVGTPAYIAPELLGGTPANERSDIFALGAVMYQLLCGQPPQSHKDAREMFKARLTVEPQPVSQLLGEALPCDLEAVISKCLRRRPSERYQSAEEVLEALDRCRLDVLSEDREDDAPTNPREGLEPPDALSYSSCSSCSSGSSNSVGTSASDSETREPDATIEVDGPTETGVDMWPDVDEPPTSVDPVPESAVPTSIDPAPEPEPLTAVDPTLEEIEPDKV